jgi:hypothetical protein
MRKNDGTLSALSVEYKIDFANEDRKRNTKREPSIPMKKPPGIPRVARLLALAHHYLSLINQGVVRDYAEIASLYNLSRARLSQIMNLALLAPKIQEEILFSSDRIKEKSLRRVLKTPTWEEQIRIWNS